MNEDLRVKSTYFKILRQIRLARKYQGILFSAGLASLVLTAALPQFRHGKKDLRTVGDYKILDNDTAEFLLKNALYDNMDGKSAPYKLNDPNCEDFSETGTKTFRILHHLNGLRNGTYLEAGAYNGEASSTTLALELHHGWTGILVEPVPLNFRVLKSKGRRALMVHGCISPKPNAVKAMMTIDAVYDGSGSLPGYPKPPGKNKTQIRVTCFPFMDIFRVSGLKKLDLVYLDVQGPELDILRTIPIPSLGIRFIGLEIGSDRRRFLKEALDLLHPFGFTVVDQIAYDFMFLKTFGPKEAFFTQ